MVEPLRGRRILIVGTGREAAAVAELAEPIAASVVAFDDQEGPGVDRWRQRWGERIPVVVGSEPEVPEVAVVSPGVSKHHPLVQELRRAEVNVTSGTSLWMAVNGAATIAVTGSKGKSTTSSLIHHLATKLRGETLLGGNIGVPLLAVGQAPRYVVELSSYQCTGLSVSPHTVVLTSLFAEHLDWHGSEAEYFADKLNIVAHEPQRIIVNALDPRLMGELSRRFSTLTLEPVGVDTGFHVVQHEGEPWFALGETPLFARSVLPLRGEHNALNACLALAAINDAEFSVADNAQAVAAALSSFSALEHRLEEIPDASGLTFIDDSLSTSPFAAIEALRAYEHGPACLLLGGQDRGVDYSPLVDHLAQHPIAAVIGLPGSGRRIVGLLPRQQPVAVADDMLEAVRLARSMTPVGGFVLLSPAAPSYGLYNNYAERAADFRAAIVASG